MLCILIFFMLIVKLSFLYHHNIYLFANNKNGDFMNKFKFNSSRTDLKINQKLLDINDIEVLYDDNHHYSLIHYNNFNKEKIKKVLKKEIKTFLNNLNISNYYHALIIGLGNDLHTADSIGSKTLQYIKVNTQLETLGIKIDKNKLSALEPGVLGKTGIETRRIIESVVDEIKPDIAIIIDSFVSNDISYLNKTIEITDSGITPGSGLFGIQKEINQKTLGIPIIVIGVTSAIEVKIKNEKNLTFYLLSTNDIDKYVSQISKVIADAINEVIYDLN